MASIKSISIKDNDVKLLDQLSDIQYKLGITSTSEIVMDAIREYVLKYGTPKPIDERKTQIPNIYSTSREITQFYDSIKSILEYDGLSDEIDKWREIHAYNKGRFYKKETRSPYYDIMRQT